MRRASALLLPLAACAHWGTTNVVSNRTLELPTVTSTYLAPPRSALAPDAAVTGTAEPPPPGSTVLAVSSCSANDEACLQALLDETRRLGGSGLFGVHSDYARHSGHTLTGSIVFEPMRPNEPRYGRPTDVRWRPAPGDAHADVDVFLQRRDPDLVLRGAAAIENWHLVCKLPCQADLDSGGSYRLIAPGLAGDPPLSLEGRLPDRLRVTTREGKPNYGRFWWGLGLALVGGGVSGGTAAYFFANPGKPAGVAELTVGLTVLPLLFIAIEDMLLGPSRPVELAVEPDP